jgi:hypothetical protein
MSPTAVPLAEAAVRGAYPNLTLAPFPAQLGPPPALLRFKKRAHP